MERFTEEDSNATLLRDPLNIAELLSIGQVLHYASALPVPILMHKAAGHHDALDFAFVHAAVTNIMAVVDPGEGAGAPLGLELKILVVVVVLVVVYMRYSTE